MISIKCINNKHDFFELQNTWNSLLASSEENNPFLTHQWLYSWWEAFGQESELHILLFYEVTANDECLVAILPGYIKSMGFFPSLNCLRFLGSEVVTSDFLGIIVLNDKEVEVCRALGEYLKKSSIIHLTELTDIPDQSVTAQILKDTQDDGLRVTDWKVRKWCPYIELPHSPEAFFSSLSVNTRKRYRFRRKLEAQGLQLEIIRDQGELSVALEDFKRLHNQRRQQKGQSGIFATDNQQLFYERTLKRFFEAGWLELAFLRIRSERVAVVCQFNYAENIYYYQAGYNIDWEQSRVGFVMLCLLIEKAIIEKKRFYEFLRGEEDYKYHFGATQKRMLMDLTLRNGSFYGEIGFAKIKTLFIARRQIKKTLPEKLLATIRSMTSIF